MKKCGQRLQNVMQCDKKKYHDQSRGIFHTEFNECYDLPDDYSYSQEFWGELYYKSYGEMTAEQARSKCEDLSVKTVRLFLFHNHYLKMHFMLIYIQTVKYGLG